MSSLVNFQIFTSGKSFSTAWKLADKWLFAGMNTNMVDQLVLCLESRALSRATIPVASVVGIF